MRVFEDHPNAAVRDDAVVRRARRSSARAWFVLSSLWKASDGQTVENDAFSMRMTAAMSERGHRNDRHAIVVRSVGRAPSSIFMGAALRSFGHLGGRKLRRSRPATSCGLGAGSRADAANAAAAAGGVTSGSRACTTMSAFGKLCEHVLRGADDGKRALVAGCEFRRSRRPCVRTRATVARVSKRTEMTPGRPATTVNTRSNRGRIPRDRTTISERAEGATPAPATWRRRSRCAVR